MDAIQTLLVKCQVKQAEGAVDPVAVARSEQARQIYKDLWRKIQPILMGSVGLGVAARGAQGLYNTVSRNLEPPEGVPSDINVVPHMVRQKQAVLRPSDAVNVEDWAATIPAKALAMVGGGLGGYKLTDMLLDKRRKADLNAELEAAKKQYEQALYGNVKTSADGTLAKDLDRLANKFAKKADALGNFEGAYLTAAGTAALLAALAGYKQQRAGSKRTILQKAKEQQLREQPPQPIFISPQYAK